MVVYSDFKSKVIIPQQHFQYSHFEINKHQHSSININMKVFDSGLNRRLHFYYNQPFNCFIIMIFDGYLEEYVLHSKKKNKTDQYLKFLCFHHL